MDKTPKDSDEIKRIESESWKGDDDLDVSLYSFQEMYIHRWNVLLQENSIKDVEIKGKRIINVGGGSGREAEFLLLNGASKVLLVDIAPGQLNSAANRKKKHQLENLDLELGDAESLSQRDKSFDLGYIFMALHHFPSHEDSISEICRVSEMQIFVDIMDAGLTRILNFFGLFKEEGHGIKPNRLREDEIKNILKENGMNIEIKYYFYPPYYGNKFYILYIIRFFAIVVNMLINFQIFARFFGNVAIIRAFPNGDGGII